MSDLLAITYKGHKAFDALAKLGELQKMQLIELEDAAVATMDEKGKVKIKQTLESQRTGTAVSFGFFWGFLIGLIFGGPLFWGLATALLSGLIGKRTDIGIDNQFMKEVGESLETGDSALFLLVIKMTRDKVLPEMEQFGGTVYQTSLSKEAEANLQRALEHEHVNEAAGQMLELDDELERLGQLKEQGIITEEEFEAKKKQMLGT
ncbi:MAG: DUF1269 domain-containing protein [Candidatus Promineifilaceae bacterium]